MLAKVYSCALVGLEGAVVEVEADLNPRALPSVTLVGLPDAAVKESTERVRAAIYNSGLTYPRGRLTVNLAPADLRKEGPAYDLPIAVALLILAEQVPSDLAGSLFLGELSLDGSVRHVEGVLPMAHAAKELGYKSVFVPQADAPEAALVEGIDVYPVDTLGRLAAHFRDYHPIEPYRADLRLDDDPPPYAADFQDIKGQEHVKRALEVAAAGGHNVLMSGPPGSGKTLLARSMPSILPRMTPTEALDVTRIYSVAGMLPGDVPLIRHRPFRAPHHTISHAGLVGGGQWPRPGEISLAHRGVLFLDEMPEFGQHGLEVLAPTARRPDCHHQPRAGQPDLPGEFHAGRRAKPMSLRLLGRPGARLLVQPDGDQPLPEAPLRPAARPDRHPRRGAARPVPEAQRRAPRRAIGGDPGARRGGAGAAIGAVRQRRRTARAPA